MTASSTSVCFARLGLLGCVYYDFMPFFDDFDSKFMIWCSNFNGDGSGCKGWYWEEEYV
jgi:hypothetical protein